MGQIEETMIDIQAARAHLRARDEQDYARRETWRVRAVESARVAARAVFPRFPQAQRAFLFGSTVRPGAMRRGSDIDIAVEGHLNAVEYFALWQQLESALPGYVVELVELDKDLHFSSRVRESGVLLYEIQDTNIESGHRR